MCTEAREEQKREAFHEKEMRGPTTGALREPRG